MIFNLRQFLVDQFPTYSFTVNGFTTGKNVDEIVLNDTGGSIEPWFDRSDVTVQIITRNNSVVIGKGQIEAVFDYLRNRFGCELPETTVGGDTLPAVKAWKIAPIQTPQFLGSNTEGMALFSFNITVTLTEV